MADTCIECDVAIVGSGFAGSLIAKELSQKPIDTPMGSDGSMSLFSRPVPAFSRISTAT